MPHPDRTRGRRLLAVPLSLLLLAGMIGFLGGSVGFAGLAAAGTTTVTVGAALSPPDLTVPPGTTVTWSTTDSRRHRIRSTAGPAEFDSDDIDPGGSWSFTFTTPGTYSYVDHRNESLHGTVTVQSGAPNPGGGGGGTGGGGAPPPSAASVRMAGKAFSPGSVTVAVGGVVTWTNNDTTAHNVTSTSGAFRSATLQPGQTFTFTFTTPGTYPYLCTLHGGMNGTIVVPTAGGTVPPPAGGGGGGGGAPPPPAAGGGGGGQAVTYQVQVRDNTFSPATLNARVGDTVVWTNVGRSPHTVTARNGSFNRTVNPGETYRLALSAQGSIGYQCIFHPGMNGTLVVAAPLPGVAVPPASGGSGGSSGGGFGPVNAAPPPASTGKFTTYEIKAKEMSFAPAIQQAHVGDTISWVNTGAVPHTVTARDHSFDRTLMPGQRFNLVLTKAGTIDYVCTFHPGMNGQLVVGAALADVPLPAQADNGAPAPAAVAHRHGSTTTYEVQVKDNSFGPAMLDARVGDTVVWINVGAVPHTVTAVNHSFDRTLAPGEKFSLLLTRAGDIDYVCTPHRGMFGMVMVAAALPGTRVAGPALTVGALSPVSVALIGLGWLLVVGLLASAQLRARTGTAAAGLLARRRTPAGGAS